MWKRVKVVEGCMEGVRVCGSGWKGVIIRWKGVEEVKSKVRLS